jgi:hypothetical protein
MVIPIFLYLSASDMEPGLALMDEIGRRALTNAFINFIRNTSDPSAYRDSLIYDQVRVTNVDETYNGRYEDEYEDRHRHRPRHHHSGIPKCPSAPDIAHHKLDPGVIIHVPKQSKLLSLGRAATVSGEGKRTPSPRGGAGGGGGDSRYK